MPERKQNSPETWEQVCLDLKAIPPQNWSVYNDAKIGAGFVRPWEGVSPDSPELLNPNFLQTHEGELIIPTYTYMATKETWEQVTNAVTNHITAVTKLGQAILKSEREGLEAENIPNLRELGFSDDERDILLSRPDITDLFLISRTDYTVDTDEDGAVLMKRYETNCSQPGGAEVVDAFSMPDAVQGSLPFVSDVLDKHGIHNHRVLPTYIESIKAFWEKYHPNKKVKGVSVLSGGYGFGTQLLLNELQARMDTTIIPENEVAPRPLSEDREHIKQAAREYAEAIAKRYVLDENQLYHIDENGTREPIDMIIHEPRIDIEHFAALKDSDLVKAWKAGLIEIVNPPQARVCGTKKLEAIIAKPEVWEAMDRLGFGMTDQEKDAETKTTIATSDLTHDAIKSIEEKGQVAYQKLVVKPAIAGSGRGIIMGRSYATHQEFIEAIKAAAGVDEPYIIMEEVLPAQMEIVMHIPNAPQVTTRTDLDPYTISYPSANGDGPNVLVPGAVSRAHLPLTSEEEVLAEQQGIKLNVLGPENYFTMSDGSKRQYLIAIGNLAVV